MSEMFKVSQSKVKTWRRCRAAYHYKYVEKLRKKTKSRALTFGSLVHEMIEADANGNDPFDVTAKARKELGKLFASEREERLQMIGEAEDIMEEYFNHWDSAEEPLVYEKIGDRYAEHQFEIEILPGILWNGKIDATGKSRGLKWLVEHKTFNRRPTEDDRWRNLQSVSYFKVFEIMGWGAVDGTCWDYIWSKAPPAPRLLKDKSLSQAKLISLPNKVRSAIKDYGFDITSYRSYIRSMEANRKEWFSRVFTTVNQEVSGLVFNDFLSTMQEMADGHGKIKDHNIERHCTWCDYEPLCRARMQALDVEYVKERQYVKSDGKDKHENPEGVIHRLTHKEITGH